MYNTTEPGIVDLLLKSEERIVEYCEELHANNIELALLDDEVEQALHENRLLCNVVKAVATRIAITRKGYSSPEIALAEINEIIDGVNE